MWWLSLCGPGGQTSSIRPNYWVGPDKYRHQTRSIRGYQNCFSGNIKYFASIHGNRFLLPVQTTQIKRAVNVNWPLALYYAVTYVALCCMWHSQYLWSETSILFRYPLQVSLTSSSPSRQAARKEDRFKTSEFHGSCKKSPFLGLNFNCWRWLQFVWVGVEWAWIQTRTVPVLNFMRFNFLVRQIHLNMARLN